MVGRLRLMPLLLSVATLLGGCAKSDEVTLKSVIENHPIIVVADLRKDQDQALEVVTHEIWLLVEGAPFTPEIGVPLPLTPAWRDSLSKLGNKVLIAYSASETDAWPHLAFKIGKDGKVGLGKDGVNPEHFKRQVLEHFAAMSKEPKSSPH